MAAGAPQRLRADGLSNPLGIDSLRPLLSWWPMDERDAEVATACHLQAASSVERLERGDANLWDSGRVQAAASHCLRYAGREITAGERVHWRVRTIDSDGAASPWSAAACFEIGLPGAEHWRGRWITAGLRGGRHSALPAAVLSTTLELRRPLAAARLAIACLGDCRVHLNGDELPELASAAPWTDYRRVVSYRWIDVTERVSTGLNRLEVLLGDGRYCGHLAGLRERYGDSPALRLQLELRYPGGDRDWLVSDGNWRWRFAPLQTAEDGEVIDLRRALAVDKPIENPVQVIPIAAMRHLQMRAAPQPGPAIQQQLPAVSQRSSSDLVTFDFGERVTGRAVLQVSAEAMRDGRPVTLRYLTDPDAPESGQDRFTLATSDETADGVWQEIGATFAVHRFRYVEVSGLKRRQILEATAHAISEPQRHEHEILCDAPVLSSLVESAQATLADTLQGYVSDDAGLGDLAAVALGARGMLATDDVLTALQTARQQLLDAVESQPFPGRIAPAVPGLGDAGEDVPLASDALVILPWTLYRCAADIDGLRAAFPAIKRFVAALQSRYPGGVRSAARLPGSLDAAASRDLMPTALYFYSVSLAARAAAVLGDSAAFKTFEALAERVRGAFLQQYVTAAGRLIDSSLEACLLTLHVGVLDGDARDRVRAELLAQVSAWRAGGGVLTDSPLACGLLLPVLTALDRLDVAYDLMLQPAGGVATPDSPSPSEPPSIRSIAQIGLMDWVVSCAAGIDLDPDIRPHNAGYARARLRPRPPLGVRAAGGPPLGRIEASLATVSGRYELGWSLSDDSFEVRALVPPGCTAVLIMPDGAEHALSSGRHLRTMSLLGSVDALPIVTELPDQDIA